MTYFQHFFRTIFLVRAKQIINAEILPRTLKFRCKIMDKELNFWGKFLSIGHERPILLSKIYQQDVLTNWRCHRKFCFLFWLLSAEMPRHPLQFFFLSVQNLNVIPISCPGTVCLFHKTDMGGGTTISYCGKLSITHLL